MTLNRGAKMSPSVNPVILPASEAGQEMASEWVVPSWTEVVENHSTKVFRLAYRLTGNKYDAEDLTQEVFVRVFKSLANFKQRIRFDTLSEDAAARLPGNDPGPERTFEFNNLDNDIAAALEALPPDFRAAVVLCDMEGLSYDEVANALGIKLGTVRSRIHRGRSMLRESLADRAPGRSSTVRPARKPLLSLPRMGTAS